MRSFSIEWLPEALEEKKGILDFLEGKSVIAALAIDDHMERQVGQLGVNPTYELPGANDRQFFRQNCGKTDKFPVPIKPCL